MARRSTPQPLFEAGKVFFDARADRVHARLRLLERDAVLQPRERREPVEVARHVRRQERQRPPDLRRGAIERAAFGQDADDRVRLAVE